MMRHLLPYSNPSVRCSRAACLLVLSTFRHVSWLNAQTYAKKEALVVWNERNTQCLLNAYRIFYDDC